MTPPPSNRRPRPQEDVDELTLLFEICELLDSELELRDAVGPVLKTIAKRMGMSRGSVTLLNRETGEIVIEAAHGLSSSQLKRGRYQIGEGVTGTVVETGKPVVVPRVSLEPLFLNRTKAFKDMSRSDVSFICVPVKSGPEVIGTLSADRLFNRDVSIEEDARLLQIIASLISQAARLRQKMLEERERLKEENIRLQEELRMAARPANIIGNSKPMHSVYTLIEHVALSDTTVLIRGASGTGKELVAHAIHYASPRAGKPYIKVNCGALPEGIIESELFGHEKGAFTGATQLRKGRFELADGGTIFLDECGDLPMPTQIKLLRVLQERELERVGGTKTIKVNVRVIAATNRNLEESIKNGEFREDLYYRLNVFPIHVPSLTERRTDIVMLADHFIEKYSRQLGKHIKRISTPAIDMLQTYHWPGNVRELENTIERAVLLSTDGVIHGHHLPPSLQTAEASDTQITGTLQATLDNVERELIIEALKSSRGNKAEAARKLGVSERLMGLRVNKHGIDPKRFHT